MSVPPDQIPMMNAAIKEHGVTGVEYDPNGGRRNCIITSRAGRAQWMKIFGNMTDRGSCHDKDGGYGDG
jgi:hypothetical protein